MKIENLRKALLVDNIREGKILQSIVEFLKDHMPEQTDIKFVCPAVFERTGTMLEDLVITDSTGDKFTVGIGFSVPKGFGIESLSIFNNNTPDTAIPQIIEPLKAGSGFNVLLKSDIKFSDLSMNKDREILTKMLQEISSQELSELEDPNGLVEWYVADITTRIEKIIDSYIGQIDRMFLPVVDIINYLTKITIDDLCLGITYPNRINSDERKDTLNHVAGIRIVLKHNYTFLINGERIVIDPFDGSYPAEKLRFNTNIEQLLKHNCYSRYHGAAVPPMISLKSQDK